MPEEHHTLPITLDAQGRITNALDILCIQVALHTVVGHRLQDDALATNLIVAEANKQLAIVPQLEVKVGSYFFLFTKES